MPAQICLARQIAKRENKRIYDGSPCKHCGNTQRFVSDYHCVTCRSLNDKQRYQADPVAFSNQRKKWRIENIEYAKLKDKQSCLRNKERRNATARAWRENNPEKQRKATQQWIKNNPDRVKSHRSKRMAKRRGAEGSYTAKEWRNLKEKYQNRCINPMCACSDKLTPDHVIPLSKGGTNYITNVQPLCLKCNQENWWHFLKHGHQIDYRDFVPDIVG